MKIMLKKIQEWFNDRNLELKERLFRIILVVGLMVSVEAIITNFALEHVWINVIPLLALIVIMGVASIATFKYHRVEFSAVLIGVLIICGIFPYMFFASGGISGGATVWFVLGILYIFLMFSGKKLAFFLGLVVFADIITYMEGYFHPEWIVDLASENEIYFDSLCSVLAVGLAVGIIIKFQLRMYEKEREFTLEQNEELEQFSRSKDHFFSYISHEIRTPINTIIGLNEMILREDVSKEVAEDAQNVMNAGKVLLSLVNDILDIAKIENKKMEIIPVEYNVGELFLELVQLVSVQVKEKKLELMLHLDEGLPSVLCGDEKRIRQVILNLLTNAIKYTERGCVNFSIGGEMAEEGTVNLEISVADTGIGIKREELGNLFEVFKRVDLKNNRKIEGSGLGLSIVKRLVDLMGGEVTVKSIYGKGSVFTVKLPQKIVDDSPVGIVDSRKIVKESGKEHYKQSFEAPEARILIVDDDENNLMVASKLLRATRVFIDTAQSGRECLEYTRNGYYHIILMDYLMPGMDGIETMQKIRKQENGLCRETPIVVLTANTPSVMDEKRYSEEGFDGYLSKPVDGEALEAEILKFLPENVVEYRREKESQKQQLNNVLQHKRKKIIITSDCVSDLPRELREKYDIRLMYTYIATDKGNFQDTREIGSDNIFRQSAEAKNCYTVSAPVEEYEAFYAEMLTEAENVIHISLSSRMGTSYANASSAAKEFYHVTIIDSGHISCGEGLLVLYAANMAKNGCSVQEICNEIERVKGNVETTFLFASTKSLYRGGYLDKTMHRICEYFNFYPVIKCNKGTVTMCGIQMGKLERARKRYIRRRLLFARRIHTDIVYVTYTGCTTEEQERVLKEIKKRVDFKRVIMQKASVSSACNAGYGAIGIAYVIKKVRNKKGKYA